MKEDLGRLLLRLALGGLFFAHAGLKLFGFGLAATGDFFASLGLPRFMGGLTIAWEVFGGLLLVLGWQSRRASLAMCPVLLGAIAMVHGKAGFYFDAPNGGWEFPAFWIVALLVVGLIGPGRFSLDHGIEARDE